MPEYIGYTGAPAGMLLSPAVKVYLEGLEREISVPIKVHFGNLGHLPAIHDDAVHIHDLATPGTDTTSVRLDHLYVPLERRENERMAPDDTSDIQAFMALRQRNILRNSDNDYHVINGEQGYYLGHTAYRNIWYRFSLRDIRNGDGISLDRMIDQVIGRWVKFSLDEQYYIDRIKNEQEEVRTQFVDIAKITMNDRVQRVMNNIAGHDEQVAEYQRRLIAEDTALKGLYRELENAEEFLKQDEEKLNKEMDELVQGSKFKKVKWDSETQALKIYTEELFLYSPDGTQRVPLGAFEVRLNPSNKVLTIHNLTNRKGGRQHPHVPETGNPCWGAMEGPIRTLLRDMELIALFELTLQYLEQFNPDDTWGRWAGYWWDTQDKQVKKGKEWLLESEAAKSKSKAKKATKEPAEADRDVMTEMVEL